MLICAATADHESVQKAAVGALRNLTFAKENICEMWGHSGVLTALLDATGGSGILRTHAVVALCNFTYSDKVVQEMWGNYDIRSVLLNAVATDAAPIEQTHAFRTLKNLLPDELPAPHDGGEFLRLYNDDNSVDEETLWLQTGCSPNTAIEIYDSDADTDPDATVSDDRDCDSL